MDCLRYIGGEREALSESRDAGRIDDIEIRRLVERAAKGDIEAFGEIYSIHLDRIYRYIFCHVRDRAAAEDLTEEVFMKAWDSLAKFKWQGFRFSSWLYRIAHNHMIDHFRNNRYCRPLTVDLPLVDDRGPEREAEANQVRSILLDALSNLPKQQKQLITLKFIEGLDNSEIGHIMKKSEGAVRIMQMRALQALRESLNGVLP
ncbi:MAG: sigma-70 family RNA polymerase sigma factor [Dehalococcoidia bacterium]|nr:sigma-70 family RNA polymerase sigma factor [Dehalococcoidia bacterium]